MLTLAFNSGRVIIFKNSSYSMLLLLRRIVNKHSFKCYVILCSHYDRIVKMRVEPTKITC